MLAAFVRNVDDAVLARAPHRSGAQPARDALFEVIMSRFDVLAAYKPALKSIAASWPMEAPLVRALCQSQAWMLRAAGIRSEGLDGQLRAAGLGTVYASVYRTWLGDDDPGLAKTMAALDRRLRRGERTLQIGRRGGVEVLRLRQPLREGGTQADQAGATPIPNTAADPAATVPPGALS